MKLSEDNITLVKQKEFKMPIQLNQEDGGKILVVHVSGKLTKADYEHIGAGVRGIVQQHRKLRLLFDMTGFHGWDVGALWADIKFDVRHHADIQRLAMVGERKWERGMASFCKPFTKATIRYLDHAGSAKGAKVVGGIPPPSARSRRLRQSAGLGGLGPAGVRSVRANCAAFDNFLKLPPPFVLSPIRAYQRTPHSAGKF